MVISRRVIILFHSYISSQRIGLNGGRSEYTVSFFCVNLNAYQSALNHYNCAGSSPSSIVTHLQVELAYNVWVEHIFWTLYVCNNLLGQYILLLLRHFDCCCDRLEENAKGWNARIYRGRYNHIANNSKSQLSAEEDVII